MNWRACRQKESWLNLRNNPGICLEELKQTTNTSFWLASLWAKTWTWDLLNIKQECHLLDCDILFFITIKKFFQQKRFPNTYSVFIKMLAFMNILYISLSSSLLLYIHVEYIFSIIIRTKAGEGKHEQPNIINKAKCFYYQPAICIMNYSCW
jgi:hypothetical protein